MGPVRHIGSTQRFLDWVVMARRGVQPPFSRHTLEDVRTAIVECDSRAVYEILDGVGDQHFIRGRFCGDPRRYMDCDPTDVVTASQTLPRVQPAARL